MCFMRPKYNFSIKKYDFNKKNKGTMKLILNQLFNSINNIRFCLRQDTFLKYYIIVIINKRNNLSTHKQQCFANSTIKS